jgi:hypothetical protein
MRRGVLTSGRAWREFVKENNINSTGADFITFTVVTGSGLGLFDTYCRGGVIARVGGRVCHPCRLLLSPYACKSVRDL